MRIHEDSPAAAFAAALSALTSGAASRCVDGRGGESGLVPSVMPGRNVRVRLIVHTCRQEATAVSVGEQTRDVAVVRRDSPGTSPSAGRSCRP